MIRKILLALLLGCFFTLLYLPHDPFFKQMVAQQFAQIFNNAFDCTLSFKQVHIHLWQPSLCFEDIQVEPAQGSGWKWGATSYSMRCSWWHILSCRSLDLDMGLENFKAESEYYDGVLAIEPHVKKMILGKPIIPITLVQLQINNALLGITQKGSLFGSFTWNASVHEQDGALHVALQLLDGSVSLGSIACKKLAASLRGQFCPTQAGFIAQGALIFDTYGQAQPYTFTASMIDDQIVGGLRTDDGMHLDITYCLQNQKGDFAVAVPLEKVKSVANIVGYNLPNLQGKLNAHGSYTFGEKLCIDAAYAGNVCVYEKEFSPNGMLTLAQNKLNINGTSDLISYYIDFDADKKILEQARVMYAGKPLITAGQTEQSSYTLQVDLELACLALKINELVKGQLHAEIELHDGHCLVNLDTPIFFALVPHTFYSLQKVTGLVDICFADRSITLDNLAIMLDKGQIACPYGLIHFDANSHATQIALALKLIDIPLKIDPNISGEISGQLTLQKSEVDAPKISGTLLIDDAKIDALEYAWDFSRTHKGKLPLEIDVDIKIATRQPAHINMPLLKGDLIANLHIQNTLNAPTLMGTCQLQKGILQLPYKPLYLEKAELTFNKNEPMPLIHVIGLNTIKQHDLMVQLFGPLNNYQLIFSANPNLEPQEIIALLLTGNSKSAPTTFVPTVAGQAICDYLSYENKNYWFKFLERVRLVPHFDDQSARGGIRAAFEITVTEQLRALIQKNFTLTEDTRWQLEYDATDDIAFRATRDERRDLNAEIEMRWKF